MRSLHGLIGRGLAAAVYTQTTDVEGEVNGLMTYDRAMLKVDEAPARRFAQRLYKPAQKVVEFLPTSQYESRPWQLLRKKPPKNWNTIDFDDEKWIDASGPLRAGNNSFLRAGTVWGAKEIWARTTFGVEQPASSVWMQVYHDVSQLEVYVNGNLIRQFKQPRPTRRHYQHIHLSDYGANLQKGKNVLAVHAIKQKGARAVDVGLYAVERP